MGRIRLIKLEVIDTEGDISCIEFGPKLTIITGPSDTGKSWIMKCVSYALGDSEIPFTDPLYKTVRLTIDNGEGQIVLKRDFGGKCIAVYSNSTTLDLKDLWDEEDFNLLFGKILGVAEGFTVPADAKGTLKAWSWRVFSELFLLKQGWTSKEKSILLPKSTDRNDTYFKAMLINALDGSDFNEYKSGISIEEAEHVRYAKQLIDTEKVKISQEIKRLEEELEGMPSAEEFEPVVTQLEEELRHVESRIDGYVEDEKRASQERVDLNDRIAEIKGQIERYGALQTQYESDLKRLNFVVSESRLLDEHDSECHCPVCDQVIQGQLNPDFEVSAKAEVQKIIISLNGLVETINSLLQDLDDLERRLVDKEDEIARLRESRKQEKARRRTINDLLSEYQAYLVTKARLEAYQNVAQSVGVDIEIKSKQKPPKRFSPAERMPADLKDVLMANMALILKQSDYPWDVSVTMTDMGKMDILVDNKPKTENSFGYTSHFNSVFWLAFREYFNMRAQINPRLYFVDTPLLGLSDKKEKDANDEGIRAGFFKYIFGHQEDDQLIIIENTEEEPLPSGYECNPNICVISFTHDSSQGRYGFLNKMRKRRAVK